MNTLFNEMTDVDQAAFTDAFYQFFSQNYGLKPYFDSCTCSPWGCPWYYYNSPATELIGKNPKAMGITWAQECEEEIMELLREEAIFSV